MNEEAKIIEQLKKLNKSPGAPNEEKFLKCLKMKLSDYVAAHPAKNANLKFPWYAKRMIFLERLKLILGDTTVLTNKAIGAVVIVSILGVSGAAIASQNSLPGETLYPVKILTENMRSNLAFTPESKAKIQSDFATRRVAEVKIIIERNDGANPEKLSIAMANLQKNTNDTAAIINEESKKGNDVAELAKDVNNSIGENTENLKQIFKDKNNNLKKEEIELKNKIIEAKKTNDEVSVKSLNTKLDETKNVRKSLESSWDKNEETLQKNIRIIEKRLGEKEKQLNQKNRVEKSIEEAKKEKQELTEDALREGTVFAPDAFIEFDSALNKAIESYAQKNYDGSEAFAEEAIRNLKNLEKDIEEKNEREKQFQNSMENQLKNDNAQKENDLEEEISIGSEDGKNEKKSGAEESKK